VREAAVKTPEGTVLNIQRYSTHDGPGVRTTVFLKGCSNACAWCHNPESLSPRSELQIFPDRCIGCGACLQVCPGGAHRLEGGEKKYFRERCTACGRCADECFAGAIEAAGRTMTTDAVMEEVLQDATYYGNSGGGVTFSGGEPVLQAEFLGELLRRSKESGLHTAVQTAGNYDWEELAGILPLVDLVMCDLKFIDPALHRQYVGNDGTRIRKNFQRLGRQDAAMAVRTPVVGGANDAPEEIAGIARFIREFRGLRYYELIPYHALGESKRKSLGLPAKTRFHTPSRETMERLADAAREYVAEVRWEVR
jgi:pyruvate formate lyase activating enzyme